MQSRFRTDPYRLSFKFLLLEKNFELLAAGLGTPIRRYGPVIATPASAAGCIASFCTSLLL